MPPPPAEVRVRIKSITRGTPAGWTATLPEQPIGPERLDEILKTLKALGINLEPGEETTPPTPK
ncbi:hypothetical protein A2634_01610 [Candidatus Amesbacteria bacterium RIFCSPHIGHO2_01_FULL_48_32]|uniref:Uncharacterized protein n=1 Tax=Candidatus Amesbacteria bacterium RIFCSPLOWO2_01_FULL_48_25 TaxID=1797259 RepID=A0A1F4ZC18_9BACT|nr:MAG: hypothetical protein A2634_01610 [Candidatus Amesbacteria bacterium RIFCSPHIGHO2_01_FULL_48_32]OGD03738.1 MAG: hypothetical protein A2989_03595 [Candidatus Amesbacteria bacterium RIFCSPLOWO2_01_FULL_48_25]